MIRLRLCFKPDPGYLALSAEFMGFLACLRWGDVKRDSWMNCQGSAYFISQGGTRYGINVSKHWKCEKPTRSPWTYAVLYALKRSETNAFFGEFSPGHLFVSCNVLVTFAFPKTCAAVAEIKTLGEIAFLLGMAIHPICWHVLWKEINCFNGPKVHIHIIGSFEGYQYSIELGHNLHQIVISIISNVYCAYGILK